MVLWHRNQVKSSFKCVFPLGQPWENNLFPVQLKWAVQKIELHELFSSIRSLIHLCASIPYEKRIKISANPTKIHTYEWHNGNLSELSISLFYITLGLGFKANCSGSQIKEHVISDTPDIAISADVWARLRHGGQKPNIESSTALISLGYWLHYIISIWRGENKSFVPSHCALTGYINVVKQKDTCFYLIHLDEAWLDTCLFLLHPLLVFF